MGPAGDYYDFTADSLGTASLDTQLWVTRFTNGGRTWTPRRALTTEPFDMRLAPLSGGYFMGEYQGLAAREGSFTVVTTATDTRDNDNPTNLFSWTVD